MTDNVLAAIRKMLEDAGIVFRVVEHAPMSPPRNRPAIAARNWASPPRRNLCGPTTSFVFRVLPIASSIGRQ